MEVYSFKNWEELKEYSELIFSDADRNLEEAGRELRYFNYICEEVEDGVIFWLLGFMVGCVKMVYFFLFDGYLAEAYCSGFAYTHF